MLGPQRQQDTAEQNVGILEHSQVSDVVWELDRRADVFTLSYLPGVCLRQR